MLHQINSISTVSDFLSNISIRGRLAYSVSCLKQLLIEEKVDSKTLHFVISEICIFTSSNTLDDWEQTISELTPSVILDTKADFNEFRQFPSDFLKNLKTEYLRLSNFLLDAIEFTIQVGTNNIYGGIIGNSKETLKPALDLCNLLLAKSIQFPDVNMFTKFSFNKKGGWGDTFVFEL